MKRTTPHTINFSALTEGWPVHKVEHQFLGCLGQTIASFGFLEEIILRAIYAFTGTRQVDAIDHQEAFEKWLQTLERSVISTLSNLIDKFIKVAKEHPDLSRDDVSTLGEQIRSTVRIRNMLCHASWHKTEHDGVYLPWYADRNGRWEELIDAKYLMQLQKHVADLSCQVIDTVTMMGYEFPGR